MIQTFDENVGKAIGTLGQTTQLNYEFISTQVHGMQAQQLNLMLFPITSQC